MGHAVAGGGFSGNILFSYLLIGKTMGFGKECSAMFGALWHRNLVVAYSGFQIDGFFRRGKAIKQ
jgi:hypothetical protein